jgi:hypothetical protein
MNCDEVSRLRDLERKNSRLNPIVTDQVLDIDMKKPAERNL